MKQFLLDEQQLLSDLKGLLRIKSVNRDCGPVTEQAPLGQGIYDAIEYMLALGKKFGFCTKNVDGYCGWIEMGQGAEMVAVLAHLDTVSVSPDGWIAEPFDGTLIDGKLYGRGAIDDKGPAMVALYAMKALADSGAALGRRVRLILGGDEEAGWRCMDRYRETEEIPTCAFTPDAVYPVTFAEKGMLHVDIRRAFQDGFGLRLEGGAAYNIVPAYAHAEIDGQRFEAEGKAAHAMNPAKGENAILKLAAALRGRGYVHPFLQLAEIATAEGLGIAFSDEPSGSLTINPAIALVDEKESVLRCDIRHPVTVPAAKVVEAIQKAVAPLGFTAENAFEHPPLHVAKDSPLVSTLQRVYLEATGDSREPVSTGGGTYARAFPNAVAFGALFPDEDATYHQTNEHWQVESMRKNFQILTNTLDALARP